MEKTIIHRPIWVLVSYKKATLSLPLERVATTRHNDQLEAFEAYKASPKHLSHRVQIYFAGKCVWQGDALNAF